MRSFGVKWYKSPIWVIFSADRWISLILITLHKPHEMKNLKFIYLSIFVIALSAFYSCNSNESLPTDQFNPENYLENRSNSNSSFYLVHDQDESIASSDIVQVFLSGWEYESFTSISGYTATDDLWTIISYQSKPNFYEMIKIDLSGLKLGSQEWNECVDDICQMSQQIDNIIVLDQDLEVASTCDK